MIVEQLFLFLLLKLNLFLRIRNTPPTCITPPVECIKTRRCCRHARQNTCRPIVFTGLLSIVHILETSVLFCSLASWIRGLATPWTYFLHYLYPLSFWLTLPQRVLSPSWCCLSRSCVVFLACVHLALSLALFLSPGTYVLQTYVSNISVSFDEVICTKGLGTNNGQAVVVGSFCRLSCSQLVAHLWAMCIVRTNRPKNCWGKSRLRRHCLRRGHEDLAQPTERGQQSPTFRPMSVVAKRSPISATVWQIHSWEFLVSFKVSIVVLCRPLKAYGAAWYNDIGSRPSDHYYGRPT